LNTVINMSPFKRRAEYESQVLVSRTSIILAVNALAAVAFTQANFSAFSYGIAITVIIINLFWIPCGIKANKFLRALNKAEAKDREISIDEKLRIRLEGKYKILKLFRPTCILAIIIPTVLEIAWIVGVIGLIG
jgi:hypothetical protein